MCEGEGGVERRKAARKLEVGQAADRVDFEDRRAEWQSRMLAQREEERRAMERAIELGSEYPTRTDMFEELLVQRGQRAAFHSRKD